MTISPANNISSLKDNLYIGGEWRPAASGKRFDVCDPASEAVIATVADATVEDALAAVSAAAAAASSWAETPPRRRSEILRKSYELMVERAEELARLITLENGKAIADARSEIGYAAEFFRWYSEEAVRIPGTMGIAPSGLNRIFVQYQPIGISVLVTPWNFPAAMATRKIAPALAAGCTCILKPAEDTPLTALAVADILREAGVPEGVVNVVTTKNAAPVVNAMLKDPRVRKLSFTGSTQVGRLLLKEAANQVLSCSMELGGNAPFVVFDDADVDLAVEQAIIAKMRNGGEACTAANRFYVQRGIAEAFAEKFAERMSQFTLGHGLENSTKLGPLINAKAREKVVDLVNDAVSAGSRVLTGGIVPSGPGYFYPATILVDVPLSARMLREEIFGPVAPIVTFETEDEAIALANETEYGLIAYVFTSDLARGLRVSGRIEAGMVGLNRGIVSDPAAPFGGAKQSGLGREGGQDGLKEFLEVQYISAPN